MTKSQTPNLNWSLVAILLLAGVLRFWQLDAVPPGWRDDELIEMALDTRIAAGWRPLYIEEAEGHEPLYHYVHAVTLALFGPSRASYRWLSAANGLLAVALTMALSRRLFGVGVAFWAGAAMAVGFWPLMYSRLGLRHVGILPAVLVAFYALWCGVDIGRRFTQIHADKNQKISVHPRLSASKENKGWFTLAGAALAAGLYTYFAGRVTPFIAAAFAVYLVLFHRPTCKATWRGWLWAGMLTLALVAPLGWYLTHRPLETRLSVVGQPLHALLRGDPAPALQTALGTLGMFTHTGDPEWLYNIEGRPVFNLFGGGLLWVGFGLCLYHWRQPRYAFLALWFTLGLSPAFVSIPSASLGHTILAQPVAYILPTLPLAEALSHLTPHASRITHYASRITHSVSRHLPFAICHLSFVILLATIGFRDLRDYFTVWPRLGMVRFLYHADVADLARALRTRSDVQDIAVATTSEELRLDANALAIDLTGSDVRPRLFDPTFALVLPASDPAYVALTTFPTPAPTVAAVIEHWPPVAEGPQAAGEPAYRLYRVAGMPPEWGGCPPVEFGDGLTLVDCRVAPQNPHPGQDIEIRTLWRVRASDNLAATLKFYFHLLTSEGALIATGDRLSVWLPSLHPGDAFIQTTTIAVPGDTPPGDYLIRAGVYDTVTGRRWEGHAQLGTVRVYK